MTEQTTETTATVDRPEYVPEKFWDAEAKQVKIEDVLKSYSHLESKLGSNPLVPPKDDAPQEEKDAFQQRLRELSGAPKEIDAYKDPTIPEELKPFMVENFGDVIKKAKEIALNNGITPKAFDDFLNLHMSMQLDQVKAMPTQEALMKQYEEAGLKALQEKYGDKHKEVINNATAAFEALIDKLPENFNRTYGNDPLIIEAFSNIGKRLKEGTVERPTTGSNTKTVDELRKELTEAQVKQNASQLYQDKVHWNNEARRLSKAISDLQSG